MAMKEAVRCCSQEGQEKNCSQTQSLSGCIRKHLFPIEGFTPLPTLRDQSFIIIIAEIHAEMIGSFLYLLQLLLHYVLKHAVQNMKIALQILITNLMKGHVLLAQALGSLVNKLPSKVSAKDLLKNYDVEEAMGMIFASAVWNLCKSNTITKCFEYGSEICFINSLSGLNHGSLHICAVVGFAWIGKALVMRGHEKVKDITMAFLGFLIQDADSGGFPLLHDTVEGCIEQEMITLFRFNADAFHVLMSDAAVCLNRKYHAAIRPLYKQWFFNSFMPVLLSSILQSVPCSNTSDV